MSVSGVVFTARKMFKLFSPPHSSPITNSTEVPENLPLCTCKYLQGANSSMTAQQSTVDVHARP